MIMALTKQAKTLTTKQASVAMAYLGSTRHPIRNKVIFLLSTKAGFRAKEIASLRWRHLIDAERNLVDCISLTNDASKGKSSGRVVPIHKELKVALVDALEVAKKNRNFDIENDFVVRTERSKSTSAKVIVNTFARWYADLGFVGALSHSGRRTFITNVAKKIPMAGGSLRDVMALAGHANLATTQRYIDVDALAQRKVLDLI
jgi:integrase/recombinase XerD